MRKRGKRGKTRRKSGNEKGGWRQEGGRKRLREGKGERGGKKRVGKDCVSD